MNKIAAFLLIITIAISSAQLRGVNYGNQRDDSSCKSLDEIIADFRFISTFAQAVKIYSLGVCLGGSTTIQAAQQTGLKVFLGMAAGPDWAFQNELSLLRGLNAQFGLSNVLGISVGTEDLYRGEVSADTLANEIVQVQTALKQMGVTTVPVTHTDAVPTPPQILAVEDIVMYNIFPFWQGVDIDSALAALIGNYEYNLGQANGKPVWIGETGWPSAGHNIGVALPTPENAGKFLHQFVCWANANGVPYFYFEAFDEPWKMNTATGGIESNFGMYNSNKTPKSYSVFQCDGATPVWSAPTTPTPTPTPTTSSAAVVPTTSSTTSSTSSTSSVASTFSTSSDVIVTPSTNQTVDAPSTSSSALPVPTSSTSSANVVVRSTSSTIVDENLATGEKAQNSAREVTAGILCLMVLAFVL